MDDLLDYADPRDSGGEPNLAAKTPKTEVVLLIHISLGQVAQIREGKYFFSFYSRDSLRICRTQRKQRRSNSLEGNQFWSKRQISWHDCVTPTWHLLSEGMEGIIRIGRLITSSGLLLFQKLWVIKGCIDHILICRKEKSYPIPINLVSKDFDPVVFERQNTLEEEEKSSSVMSSSAEKESSEAQAKWSFAGFMIQVATLRCTSDLLVIYQCRDSSCCPNMSRDDSSRLCKAVHYEQYNSGCKSGNGVGK